MHSHTWVSLSQTHRQRSSGVGIREADPGASLPSSFPGSINSQLYHMALVA